MDNSSNSDFKHVKSNFESIVDLKSENCTFEDVLKALYVVTTDKTIKELFKIAYDNSNDENVASEKMNDYLNTKAAKLIQSNTEAVVLKMIVVDLCFLTDLAYGKFFLKISLVY
jgi:hypothetical protein